MLVSLEGFIDSDFYDGIGRGITTLYNWGSFREDVFYWEFSS